MGTYLIIFFFLKKKLGTAGCGSGTGLHRNYVVLAPFCFSPFLFFPKYRTEPYPPFPFIRKTHPTPTFSFSPTSYHRQQPSNDSAPQVPAAAAGRKMHNSGAGDQDAASLSNLQWRRRPNRRFPFLPRSCDRGTYLLLLLEF